MTTAPAILPPLPRNHERFPPVLITDTREQHPLHFTRLSSTVKTLPTGDYSIIGGESLFAIERKTIPDLVSCCLGQNRERFFRELDRLRGFQFSRLLIVGNPETILKEDYRSEAKPQSILATLAAIEARFLPVVWAATPEQASGMVEAWACWLSREVFQTAERITKGKIYDEGYRLSGAPALG